MGDEGSFEKRLGSIELWVLDRVCSTELRDLVGVGVAGGIFSFLSGVAVIGFEIQLLLLKPSTGSDVSSTLLSAFSADCLASLSFLAAFNFSARALIPGSCRKEANLEGVAFLGL